MRRNQDPYLRSPSEAEEPHGQNGQALSTPEAPNIGKAQFMRKTVLGRPLVNVADYSESPIVRVNIFVNPILFLLIFSTRYGTVSIIRTLASPGRRHGPNGTVLITRVEGDGPEEEDREKEDPERLEE
ncbi:MAG: hypothetical protein Q9214_000531 [Letrouitia sp. 1 TL-2023]